ncbi:MAG: conserved exported protein of unknown function [Candidatus Thorarchaeota archaeon]|nr:MAG: conserved exported protein of unknown function [Candidatus Thorarchaeota archaeon]
MKKSWGFTKMKKKFSILIIVLLSINMVSVFPAVHAQESPILKVAVSITPLAGLVEAAGGDLIDTTILLPEGIEPHVAQLPQEAINAAEEADLLVFTGHFPWEESLATTVDTPFIGLEDFEGYGAELSPFPGDEEHDHSVAQDEHDHEGNPHGYWLLPRNAIAIANATRVALSGLNSTHSDTWSENFDAFVERVEDFQDLVIAFDSEYDFSELTAVVVFPAEAYVAETFGIEVVQVLQEGENTFISGGELLEIQNGLGNGSIDIIIGSEVALLQAGGEFATQLAQDTNSPLSWVRTLSFAEMNDYVSLMTYNLGAIVNSLNQAEASAGEGTIILVLIGVSGILAVIAILEAIVLIQRAKSEETF